MNQQNIYVITNGKTQPTRADVFNHTRTCCDTLFCDHEQINIYIEMVDHVPYRYASSLANGCIVPHANANTYMLYVKSNTNWQCTLSHEMYHVFQFENELPLCERECNQFADGIQNGEFEF